jgi:hypothetical protein
MIPTFFARFPAAKAAGTVKKPPPDPEYSGQEAARYAYKKVLLLFYRCNTNRFCTFRFFD